MIKNVDERLLIVTLIKSFETTIRTNDLENWIVLMRTIRVNVVFHNHFMLEHSANTVATILTLPHIWILAISGKYLTCLLLTDRNTKNIQMKTIERIETSFFRYGIKSYIGNAS